MKRNESFRLLLAGCCAGAVNGLFGAGGGMVLVPLLATVATYSGTAAFSSSVAIILPISIISLFTTGWEAGLLSNALPYLIGSAVGGYLAIRYGCKISAKWLHRILGILILWGGVRNLC